jgi:hypothetical protein
MSDPEERPVTVAELLARNERIGSPPVGGRRRRRRRSSDGVSVAELTGEIPVVRTGEIPVVEAEFEAELEAEAELETELETEVEAEFEAEFEAEVGADAAVEFEVGGEQTDDHVVYVESVSYDEPASDEDSGSRDYPVPDSSETMVIYTSVTDSTTVVADVPVAEPAPQLAADPLPRRSAAPQLSHDPRPLRRSSGAEQMSYDPVDQSVDLADLVDEHADVEELRSYMRASSDTLFSGGTVADDLARGGVAAESDDAVAAVGAPISDRPQVAGFTLWGSLAAVLQSLLAVVFGAGLFIGFDQLWRWNNLVALILSVLVVLTLAAGVRFIRKTEDIVSTLTAVAVGLLVTLGPLALQST